jgi:hypothetical protein
MLRGLYLEKPGFTIGSKVTVIENPGEITIRLDGPSAHRDPNETADDRRYARKVKRVADYQQNTQLPLRDNVVTQYLSGKMPILMQELVSRLIDGEVSKSYQNEVYQFLHSKRKPATDDITCNSLLWEIDQLPKPKRKRTARQTKPSATPIKAIPTNTTAPIPQAPAAYDSLLKPAADLQAAEPPANPQVGEYPQICGLDPGRSYIRNVLRTMKIPPPPPPRDPAAGPTMREIMERTGRPAKPPEDYPEIPPRLREFFTADELEIHDACRRNTAPTS